VSGDDYTCSRGTDTDTDTDTDTNTALDGTYSGTAHVAAQIPIEGDESFEYACLDALELVVAHDQTDQILGTTTCTVTPEPSTVTNSTDMGAMVIEVVGSIDDSADNYAFGTVSITLGIHAATHEWEGAFVETEEGLNLKGNFNGSFAISIWSFDYDGNFDVTRPVE
jgi:hypothetical protein